jgi:hypothetical protein
MGFRLFGRGDRAVHANGHGTAVLEPDDGRAGDEVDRSPDGQSIVLTYDGWRVGHLVHPERRVLDALSRPLLRLETRGGGLETIDRDEVILVVPPPLTDESPQRVAKQLIPVSVDIGVAVLRGSIHVLPGISPWEVWQRSSSGFVALTDAVLDFPDGTSETAGAVLVSRHAAHAGLQPA